MSVLEKLNQIVEVLERHTQICFLLAVKSVNLFFSNDKSSVLRLGIWPQEAEIEEVGNRCELGDNSSNSYCCLSQLISNSI